MERCPLTSCVTSGLMDRHPLSFPSSFVSTAWRSWCQCPLPCAHSAGLLPEPVLSQRGCGWPFQNNQGKGCAPLPVREPLTQAALVWGSGEAFPGGLTPQDSAEEVHLCPFSQQSCWLLLGLGKGRARVTPCSFGGYKAGPCERSRPWHRSALFSASVIPPLLTGLKGEE